MSERGGRGGGDMASALRRRARGSRGGPAEAADPTVLGPAPGDPLGREETIPAGRRVASTPPTRRRKRAKTGKRNNPDYKLAPGLVRVEVHDRVFQALKDRNLRAEVIAELDARGVAHLPGRADYGDLVESLLLEWLDRVGYGLDER